MCSVSGCTREVRSRGMCGHHYHKAWKAGIKWCSERGCNTPVKVRGLCRFHYHQWYRRQTLVGKTLKHYIIQRTRRDCPICETDAYHLVLIPKLWDLSEPQYLCYVCGGEKVNLLIPLAEKANTYRDWFGIYNYDEAGRLLKWNRTTSEVGSGR